MLVATHLNPTKTLLLIPGVYAFTAFLSMCCCCCKQRTPSGHSHRSVLLRCCESLMNGPIANLLALALQTGGTAGGAFYLFYRSEAHFDQLLNINILAHPWSFTIRITLSILIIGPFLSILWSRVIQGFIFRYKFDHKNSTLGYLEGRPGLPASRRGGKLICVFHA